MKTLRELIELDVYITAQPYVIHLLAARFIFADLFVHVVFSKQKLGVI